ncbi:MAG: AraC family transcriptional regulator [Stackebrandtia sp.]
MRSSVFEHGDAVRWDVASPRRPGRVAGVTMAGFRDLKRVPEQIRLVPHSSVMLTVDFGGAPPIVDDVSGRRHRGSLVAGLGLGGAASGYSHDLACVQVRLSELDGVTSLGDLWGREVERLGERLHEASTWDERFTVVDAFLARHRSPGPAVEPEVAWAWNRIVAGNGRVRVERLSDELGWSRKRLWSRFGAQIGLPPKRAARLVRFDHAVHRLVAGHDAARVAATFGYLVC